MTHRPDTLSEVIDDFLRDHDSTFSIVCDTQRYDAGRIKEDIDAIAYALLQCGVRPGDRVANTYGKEYYGIVTTYAILSIGACYVPVDVRQSTSRAEYIINHCRCCVVVGDVAVTETLQDIAAKVVDVKQRQIPIASDDIEVVCVHDPEALAAILYTSGSTGEPKGVMLSHKNIMAFVNWSVDEFDIHSSDVFSWHAKLNFDLSTFDLFVSLCSSARIVVIPEAITGNPIQLGEWIEKHKISIWYSVPSILNLLGQYRIFDPSRHRSLKYVLFAGEVFPPGQLAPILSDLPACKFYNLYGPTETNVCTYFPLDRKGFNEASPIPLGFPLPGCDMSILDEHHIPVAEGDVGELFVRGDCVTPGYWEMTEHRNYIHHQSQCHGTGDLVRQQNGMFFYHGRIDNMVKVNGYRVELGEIEHAASGFDGVNAVAVIATTNTAGVELVMFYTPREEAISLLRLRAHLSERLPSYMIPRRMIKLSEFPYNANGKIDRKQLAEQVPGADTKRTSNEYA